MTAQPDSFIADVFGSPVPPKPKDPVAAAYAALAGALYKGSPERQLIETMAELYAAEVTPYADPDDIDGSCDWLALHAEEVGRLFRDMAQNRRFGPDREKGE